MNWKTLKSEYLFNDLWFKVRRETCETPQGKIVSPYYVYEFPEWVNAVALTQENQVVMVRQYRHALGETCIELPGGCVDPTDANTEAAIARELLEETGYQFSNFTYLGRTSANPSTNNNLMHMFLATGGIRIQNQQLDANEEIEVELFPLDEVIQMIRRQEIVQSMHVTTLLHALERLGKLKMG